MTKSIVISERDNIAAIIEDNKVAEFYVHKGDILLNDVYLATVENILPSIDAAFVNVGSDKMGFLHASDVSGSGSLQNKLKPKQKLIVQVVKEPSGHKGPRVTMSLSLPGRFVVLMPEEKGINISRKITSAKERARLKSIVSLLKPAGVGIIVRTEAEGQAESEIQQDVETLLEKWSNIVNSSDIVEPPSLLHRDQDLLYRVIREACSDDINEIILDTAFAQNRASQILQSWNMGKNVKLTVHKDTKPILVATGVDKEIRAALQTKVNMKSGGYLYIETTEALTVVDVNSGKFTSSATQAETIKKTNIEAVDEIARQLRLRNIGGMIIIDFIDMESRTDKIEVLEALELALEPDKGKPTIGQLSDLGLVELTRHRQGQSLSEIFTKTCPHCQGNGHLINDLSFAASPQEAEVNIKSTKNKIMQRQKGGGRNNKDQRNIKTSPSNVASNLTADKKGESKDANIEKEDVDNYFKQNKGLVANSKNVKISGVKPDVVKKHLTEDYNKDVFTILEEIDELGAQVQPVKKEVPVKDLKPKGRPLGTRTKAPAKTKPQETQPQEQKEPSSETPVSVEKPKRKPATRKPKPATKKPDADKVEVAEEKTENKED